MFKRIFAAIILLAVVLCVGVRADAADASRHTKDDTWLIYWYICGADNLEGQGHLATKDIGEMQRVKLPSNVKVLIAAGSTQNWHHPTIKDGGHGIYLYSMNRLEQRVAWNTETDNMGDPHTLANFIKYGEENFPADHKILVFWDHGGLSGVCYEDNKNFKGDYLTYDELNEAFVAVYGSSPEETPFELIGFKACLTGSYELANSLANFSHYMMGAEPSVYDWNFSDWLVALAKDTSMSGAQIGRAICDVALKSYDSRSKATHTFSIIDLSKMPELRQAYEAYFDEAVKRSEEEDGFSAAFARAAESRNTDRYSNIYTDLGLLAKNTKPIMPDASKKLLGAIDKAVVYNKRGAYIKSKGISTYYPYTSLAKVFSEAGAGAQLSDEERDFYFKLIREQNSSYSAQKDLYGELLDLNVSNLEDECTVPIERKNGHFVANLTPEQIGNISSIQCILIPVDQDGNSKFGGAILISADDLKVNWKKGIVTENFRAIEPFLDGQRIVTYPSVSGRGHTFYNVPVLVEGVLHDFLVRYDTSSKKYEIIGFGSDIENGAVRDGGKPRAGTVITPLYMIISDDGTNKQLGLTQYSRRVIDEKTGKEISVPVPLMSVMDSIPNPNTGQPIFFKWETGEPFVFTRDSSITLKPIRKGNYIYSFKFTAPNGESAYSDPGIIGIRNGKIIKLTKDEFKELIESIVEANK